MRIGKVHIENPIDRRDLWKLKSSISNALQLKLEVSKEIEIQEKTKHALNTLKCKSFVQTVKTEKKHTTENQMQTMATMRNEIEKNNNNQM